MICFFYESKFKLISFLSFFLGGAEGAVGGGGLE